jgi:hypothetical protein
VFIIYLRQPEISLLNQGLKMIRNKTNNIK